LNQRCVNLYGIILQIPFPLPSLELWTSTNVPDAYLTIGSVPLALPTTITSGQSWQAACGSYFYEAGDDVGRFLVDGGKSIIFEPAVSLNTEKLAHHLTHTLICALMRHRGDLVLHASTVELDGTTIAISGRSGAGKSTTTAALLARGARLVADDVTVLRRDLHGNPLLQTGLPFLHLTHEALKLTNLEAMGEQSPVRHDKRMLRCDMMTGQSRPLDALVLLEVSDPAQSDDRLKISRCIGSEAFRVLQHCIYGPLLPADTPRVFPLQSEVVRTARVSRIVRPAGRSTLEAVVEEIAGLPLS
jgi:hypothetical protein